MSNKKSVEDYLEAILMIELEKGKVKSVDIANKLDFSKPSVSIAMKKLDENNLIYFDSSKHIVLTKKGREIAENTYKKHRFFLKLFKKIGVSEKTALDDACKIEHVISQETFNKIIESFGDEAEKI